jgi:hypothetical protein
LLKLLIDIPTDGDIATECCWILSNICTNREWCACVCVQNFSVSILWHMYRNQACTYLCMYSMYYIVQHYSAVLQCMSYHIVLYGNNRQCYNILCVI